MSANGTYRQTPLDVAVAAIVVAFAVAVSLFALRSNDVWWMLGVGRYLVETKSFIYSEPFTFTLSGAPWSPQSWAAAIVFYLVHAAAGANGLIALRVVMVAAVFAVSLRTLSRLGISWASSGVVAVFVLLVAHGRFFVRAQLFEYLYIAILMGFLLTAHERKGRAYFVVPAVLQVLWANTHPSFLLGPALVALFYLGEWASEVASKKLSFIRPFHRHDYRRAAILLGVVIAACFVNPNPAAFLSQPLGGEQRELMSRFTLEWRSPFDPAIAGAAFLPYYLTLLAIAVVSLLLCIRRLSLSAVLLLTATAYLSFQSHRFRVEFALVALFLVPILVQRGALGGLGGRIGRARARVALAALALVLVGVTAKGRVEIGPADLDVRPDRALEFVVDNDIAHRPFNTIGFGSYMTWKLYGQRLHFIDGRNFDPGLYRDFLIAQRNREGLQQTIAKYRLDAFIVPSLERSDFGMRNIHEGLLRIGWSLVHIDETAFVYVEDRSVAQSFLESHAYRYYHPLTIGKGRVDQQTLGGVIDELESAVSVSPGYARLWLDLAIAHATRGNHKRALECIERVLAIDPENETALGIRGQLREELGR